MLKLKITTLIILPVFLLLTSHIYSQTESFDVLPEDGRDELFHTYLMEQGDILWDARRAEVANSLSSVELVKERQNYLRNTYINLLGDLPEKTSLEPVVVGTLERTGYKVEKLHYQSLPNHRVTANFYIPTTGTAPYPAVLITCGHYPNSKIEDLYQDLSILFAKNGIAALIVDPICQGERYQIQDTTTGTLLFNGQSGTAAHSRLDVGAVLTGTSVVAYELWDNHRGVDYLYSRTDVVDTSRVGSTGSSGGGAQATYLSAYDSRIKVAAVNSFLTNEETLFNTIGPQTASQNLSYEGFYGIDHPDYVSMFAPKPYMILAATEDFFDIEGTKETYAEAKNIYDTLGAVDKIKFFEENTTHGYSKQRREEAVRWFCTWFKNDTTEIIEPDYEEEQRRDLWVCSLGNVVYEFEDEKTVTDLNIELADSLAVKRKTFWEQNTKDSCIKKVEELIRLEPSESIVAENMGTIDRDAYTIDKIKITSGEDVPVTGLLFIPKNLQGKASTVLYIDGRGKDEDATESGVIEKYYLDSNKVVFSIDVRGFGETSDNSSKNESKHGNIEHRNAVISLYVGKTLIGQRVGDISKALDYLQTLSQVDTSDLLLVGIDRAGPTALHAMAIDSRINSCKLFASPQTWLNIVKDPKKSNNMTHEIPSALKYYDLIDLETAISPRTVKHYDEPYFVETTAIINPKNDKVITIQNYPNPAFEQTTIHYSIVNNAFVELQLYNTKGQIIESYIKQNQGAGEYTFTLITKDLPQGIYFYRFFVDGYSSETKKLLIAQ